MTTSYPGCIPEDIQTTWLKFYSEDRVAVDGNVITSRGPATAAHFALSVVKKLKGAEVAQGVAEPMLFGKETIIV
ncbi:Protein deglycase DJ-1zDJ-1 [Podochytrium sp. JEL0797]|nr:Protein deglycase DJ-1zDJ-1 [Podochytrium sp. JEL0797]